MPDLGFDHASLGSDVAFAQAGIDDPDVRYAELQIIVDLLLHVVQSVVFGENLDAEMRRGSENLSLELRILYDRYVGNAKTSGTDLDALFWVDLDANSLRRVMK